MNEAIASQLRLSCKAWCQFISMMGIRAEYFRERSIDL